MLRCSPMSLFISSALFYKYSTFCRELQMYLSKLGNAISSWPSVYFLTTHHVSSWSARLARNTNSLPLFTWNCKGVCPEDWIYSMFKDGFTVGEVKIERLSDCPTLLCLWQCLLPRTAAGDWNDLDNASLKQNKTAEDIRVCGKWIQKLSLFWY